MSNNQNNDQNQQQNAQSRPSPFSNRFGGQNSNTANNAPANTNQNPQQNNNAQSGGSRFASGLRNRFARVQIEWAVRPFSNTAVRFDLNGLGDPFHRLLGTDLDISQGDPKLAVQTILRDETLYEKLADVLDKAWLSYDLKGAMLFYNWNDSTKQAFAPVTKVQTLQNNTNQANNNDSQQDANDTMPEPPIIQVAAPTCLRAIDLSLVFNVLARVRSQVLVERTPLALEPGFLHRALVTDDPRIIALARATGCIEETW